MLLVTGGWIGGSSLDSTESLRAGAAAWKVVTTGRLPRPMDSPALATLDNVLFLLGNFSYPHSQCIIEMALHWRWQRLQWWIWWHPLFRPCEGNMGDGWSHGAQEARTCGHNLIWRPNWRSSKLLLLMTWRYEAPLHFPVELEYNTTYLS